MAHGLPFTSVTLRANGKSLTLQRVLIDTGSAGSLFKTDDLEVLGVTLESTDAIRFMSEIGGREPVVEKTIESIEVADMIASPFTVELGAVDYGYGIAGILGLNFLLKVGARIDLANLEIGR